MYDNQHCFICRPSDFTVSEDAAIEPRTAATTALAVRRSNHSARPHPHEKRKNPIIPQCLSAGENVVIAEGTRVGGHVIIGPGVELGPGATVPAQVVRFAEIFRGLKG
jgi:acetyltransferase-like isoleucine patch superfamily enzyme